MFRFNRTVVFTKHTTNKKVRENNCVEEARESVMRSLSLRFPFQGHMTCWSMRGKHARTNEKFPHFGRAKTGPGWGQRYWQEGEERGRNSLRIFSFFKSGAVVNCLKKFIISRPLIYWQGDSWNRWVFFRNVESAGKSSFSSSPPSAILFVSVLPKCGNVF